MSGPFGTDPFPKRRKGQSLQDAIDAQMVVGSERFAGCGDADARPPNLLGYDVQRPRVSQPSTFVPGHVPPLENR